MKKPLFLLMAGLLTTINSCFILVDHYEVHTVFTTYYIGDSSIIAIEGTHIVEKIDYEEIKNFSDRSEFFVIYHDDIVKDTSIYTHHQEHYEKEGNGVVLVPERIDTTRYLYFVANKTNAVLDNFGTIPGISHCEGYKSRKFMAEIIPNINMQDVDSIIIDVFYKYH